MTLLLIYLIVAIGVSFLCSILEAVLLSVTPAYVESQSKKWPKGTRVLRWVKDNLDKSISSILILNTFAHTMGAAGVGAQAAKIFGVRWETLIAVLLTLAILYFSEIIPKTLGATFWKQLALPSAYVIRWLVILLYPLVWISAQITRLFSDNESMSAVSRDELAALVKLGRRHGSLAPQESELLQNILSMRRVRTREILTPRSVVCAVDQSSSIREALDTLKNTTFTRIPVIDQNLDTVTGLVLRPHLLELNLEVDGDKPVSEERVPIFRVPEDLPVLQLLNHFIERREHLFLVEDEYKQTAGIVTLEDAIETLLGREIVDERDTVVDMQELARIRNRV